MKCPYCAEQIKDEATVCRHCGRDLVRFKLPLLEQEVARIREELAETKSGAQRWVGQSDLLPCPRSSLALWHHALVVLLCALSFESLGLLLDALPLYSLVIPFAGGLWIGYSWRGTHLTVYAVEALLLGSVRSSCGSRRCPSPRA